MSRIPILTPENSASITCTDQTCAAQFQALMPQSEIINTPTSSIVIYRKTEFDCPKCGAVYIWLVQQVQSSYGAQRTGVDLVQAASRNTRMRVV